MPRSSQVLWILAIGAVIATAGCSKAPAVAAVWVELDRVPSTAWDPIPAPPKPPQPLGGQRATLPGLPARTVRTTGDRTLAEIEARIQADIQQAIRSLTSRLSRIYQAEIRGRESEIMAPLKELIDREIELAYGEITVAFLEYAEKRGRILPELSLLIDSTDYYKNLVRPTVDVVPIQKRYERAVQLQKDLKALDLDFRNLVDILLADAQAKIRAGEAALRAEFARLLLEADDRAAADARSEVNKRRQDLQLSPGGQARLDLPAVPSETVSTKGGSPIAPAPVVEDGQPTAQMRRAELESDLKIWLAVNGYKLEKGAADRTLDFAAWREKRTVGKPPKGTE